MTAFEIFAVVWIPISVAIVIGFAFSFDWIESQLGLDGARHPAE